MSADFWAIADTASALLILGGAVTLAALQIRAAWRAWKLADDERNGGES